jgi:hypothetical protein
MMESTEGLGLLLEGLQSWFQLDAVSTLSYAVAVCIHTMDREGHTRCLLVNRNKLASEYNQASDYTFYPQAFHPAYGNFASPGPPALLKSLTTAL